MKIAKNILYFSLFFTGLISVSSGCMNAGKKEIFSVMSHFRAGKTAAHNTAAEKKTENNSDSIDFRIRNEMTSYSTENRSFYIDLGRVSEIRQGEIFASDSYNPVTNINIQEAERVCHSMGKRLCSMSEWKKFCIHSLSEAAPVTQNKYFCISSSGSPELTSRSCSSAEKKQMKTGTSDVSSRLNSTAAVNNHLYEWVKGEKSGRAVAMEGLRTDSGNIVCDTAHYYPENYSGGQIGFRCCRDM